FRVAVACSFLVIGYIDMMFFFSSRRRHTRFSRDWSSDVCSSDLLPARWHAKYACCSLGRPYPGSHRAAESQLFEPGLKHLPVERSEERRVGKESSSGWAPSDLRKKGMMVTKYIYQDRQRIRHIIV